MPKKRRQQQPAHRSIPTHADDAREMEELAHKYPEEREQLLIDATGSWSLAGEYERALEIYDQLLAADSDDRQMIEAYRANCLWDAGHEARAREAAALLRKQSPKDPGPWHFLAELFESHDDLTTAAEWFTAGIAHVVGATAVTASAVPEGDHFTEMLFTGRHRVRRALGEPHDDWDTIAHELHTRNSAMFPGHEPLDLDELHAPDRQAALDTDDPEALRREVDRLTSEAEARRTAASHPQQTAALFWPAEEFPALLDRWPSLAEDYGTDHATHLRQVETLLRTYADEGHPRLAIAQGTVTDFETYARDENKPPEADGLRARYAADLARRGQATPWPPPRNSPCWCGSQRKYKKCCGNPATT